MNEVITTRVEDKVLVDINFFTTKEHTDRSTLVRKLIEEALQQRRLEYVLEQYKNNEISLAKAAHAAHISLGKMFFILSERKILLNITPQDVAEDVAAAKKWSMKKRR